MKILTSKWFEKVFLTISLLLLIWMIIGFIFVGSYIFLLLIEEIKAM